MALLLGYDIGSSSIKAALLDGDTGRVLARSVSPGRELEISAPRPGWAEQHPHVWWEHVKQATALIRSQVSAALDGATAIGISYQMHGLVLVDRGHEVLRPSILWCDSRSVEIGEAAARRIGYETCLKRLLNLPGNFTASKLRWVKENEPGIFEKIHKAMLPGDYIAMRMTGEIATTPSGLSEGILWDFRDQGPAGLVLDEYGIPEAVIPKVVPTFSIQGTLTAGAAAELNLKQGIAVSYRAGDQPNNAFSLNVLEPGEAAATAGTSGVVYGIAGEPVFDSRSRVNTFVHVNHEESAPRYGVLLCINGTGILNSWVCHRLLGEAGGAMPYDRINALAAEAPPGSEGLVLLPFGNGAERTLENRDIGAGMAGLNFNIHRLTHYLRAVQEGIVFALHHGFGIMREMGLDIRLVRAGRANLFLSPLFRKAFATVTGTVVELYNTDGAVGAARGAGLGAGLFRTRDEAFSGLEAMEVIEPDPKEAPAYKEAFERWMETLRTFQGP